MLSLILYLSINQFLSYKLPYLEAKTWFEYKLYLNRCVGILKNPSNYSVKAKVIIAPILNTISVNLHKSIPIEIKDKFKCSSNTCVLKKLSKWENKLLNLIFPLYSPFKREYNISVPPGSYMFVHSKWWKTLNVEKCSILVLYE